MPHGDREGPNIMRRKECLFSSLKPRPSEEFIGRRTRSGNLDSVDVLTGKTGKGNNDQRIALELHPLGCHGLVIPGRVHLNCQISGEFSFCIELQAQERSWRQAFGLSTTC